MNSRGFTLLASLFLVLFIGIMAAICLFRAQLQSSEVNQRRDMQQAFYAAESGLQNATASLKQNISFPGWPTPQPIVNSLNAATVGYYTVAIAPGLDYNSVLPTVWVQSIGENVMPAPNSGWVDPATLTQINSGLPSARALVARLSVQNPASYFIFTLADLTISSGAVFGSETDPGNIFAQDIILNPGAITIWGNVTYLGYISGDVPPVTINGTVSKSPAVNFPSVDTNFYFQNTCDNGQAFTPPPAPAPTCGVVGQNIGLYVPSDYTVSPDSSGNLNPASLCNNGACSANGVVFAAGNVDIGNVNVSQSVLIVAGGDIHITGNITAAGNAQIGLFAKGNVDIDPGAPDILTIQNAYVDADGGLFQDLSTGRSDSSMLNFTGAISARGVAGESGAILLSTYDTRNYAYDADLGTAYSIPLGPLALVSVLKWEEASPTAAFPPTS